MVSAPFAQDTTNTQSRIRPVNLSTDLAPLADLIELVFADSMDSGGRAALREMRMLSKFGPGLNVLARVNDLALGINLGYVWVEDGRIVGNVSIYPAHLPPELGSVWIVANVGVHPNYQRRGIARQLMHISMAQIRERGGTAAVLQVDYNNHPAITLYRQLGFYEERAFTSWRRTGTSRMPPPLEHATAVITRRRGTEWRAELSLAERVRPSGSGGLGWLRPAHPRFFRQGLWGRLNDMFSLRQFERLVIRSEDEREVVAALWIDNSLGAAVRLTLMVDPRFAGQYDEALLNTAIRRFGGDTMTIEHPRDDVSAAQALERYRFYQQRSVIHMRWTVR